MIEAKRSRRPSAYLEEADHVLTLTLDRPRVLNAIDFETEDTIAMAVDRLERKDGPGVLLIRARGRYFSAGFDLSGRLSHEHGDDGLATRRWYREIHALFDALEAVEKPVVAAIHGPCFGGAVELTLSCDFRLASDRASFELPEIELGVLPGSGGISRLTRLVGPANARWLVMGESVGAARAREMGLVNEVYPRETFESEVDGFVTRLAARPVQPLALAKLAIDACERLDRSTGRDLERIANTILLQSADYRARVQSAKKKKKKKPST